MPEYTVLHAKHDGKTTTTFHLRRPLGTDDYLFLHFKTSAVFTLFQEEYRIAPGTCILLSPGTPHAFYSEEGAIIHDWMHFLPSDRQVFSHLGIDINTFFLPVDGNLITSSIKRCEYELIYRSPFFQDALSAEVSLLLIKLKRQLSIPTLGQHMEALNALRLEIYQNPGEPLDVERMANAVNLSRSRFSVVYKSLFGVSPKNDLIRARVSKASYLLSLGTLSITEISDMCGYQNIYHFIRQFRTVTGMTPGAYRKSQNGAFTFAPHV